MKWMLSIFFLITIAFNVNGQEFHSSTILFSEGPLSNILGNEKEKLATPLNYNAGIIPEKKSLTTFKVSFHNFPEEAKRAFLYAVLIWDEFIVSPVPIHIEARWEALENNVLAKGNPSVFYNNFSGATVRNVYYPVALAEKLGKRDMNRGAPDIVCRFNNRYNWYLETDGNTPSTHYDLVSSALHEITHGLGFSGFLNETEGKGYYNNSNELPSIYDYFLFNDNNQQISDRSMFKSHSDELYHQMTSDNVKFCQTISSPEDQIMIDWIYAPPVWNDGTSMYHLKGYNYEEENGLMSPYAVKGRANHEPGMIVLTILSQLGWHIENVNSIQLPNQSRNVAELN